MKINTIKCRINTLSGPILMREFSYFQYHFIAMYSLSYKVLQKELDLLELNESNISQLLEKIKTTVKSSNINISHYARNIHIPKEFDLYIEDICRENPINITFSGLALVLVVAIVFSGGSVKITTDSIEAEIPPIGVGIEALKNAFNGKISEVDLKNITIENKNE